MLGGFLRLGTHILVTPPPQGTNRWIFYPPFFMPLSNVLLITTTTLHSFYSNDVNSLFTRQMLLSVCPDATAAWRQSLEGQNSCLVLNWHFARRTGTLGQPTSSGAAARASSVRQKRMSFSGNKKLPLHVVSYLWGPIRAAVFITTCGIDLLTQLD